jgi:hypothetical protein
MSSLPEAGQIWREVDPRKERYVRIIKVDPTEPGCVWLQAVEFNGTIWTLAYKSRETTALLSRFNGKRGGYDLHTEAP